MSLRQDLKEKDFVITVEINPPKGSNPEKALANATKLKGLVSAINITDNSGAGMKMCPLVLSHLIQKETGIDAVWQMTCRDRNRLALQSDLLGGAALGLVNLLPLRGDPPQDPIKEEQCYDLGTEELINAIEAIKAGKDYDGNELKQGAADFCIGAAAHPGVPDLNSQKETMARRLGLGAEFFQTQICFEAEQIDKFVESIGDDIAAKTLLGLTPLKSLKQAEFMNKNVWGVTVPDSHLEVMKKAAGDNPDSDESKAAQQKAGLELAKDLVSHIKNTSLKGIHIMAIGQEAVLSDIIGSIT